MKMRKSDIIAIVMFLIACHMMSLWCIDISVSAMMTSPDIVLTNGWRIINPTQGYHLGLYGAIFTFMILSLVVVHVLIKDKEEKVNEK